MSFCKRIILLIAGLVPALCLSAQDWQQWESQLQQSCLQADFTYVTEGKVKVSGEGKVSVQDSCFVLDLNLMQVFCDGQRRWSVDRESREVVVEKASGAIRGAIAGYKIESCKTLAGGAVKASLLSGDGTRIRLDIPLLKKVEKQPLSCYRFDTKTLDGSWVVTDLTD